MTCNVLFPPANYMNYFLSPKGNVIEMYYYVLPNYVMYRCWPHVAAKPGCRDMSAARETRRSEFRRAADFPAPMLTQWGGRALTRANGAPLHQSL